MYWLDITISVVTLAYMYLLSRQRKVGLYFGLLSQVLWLAFIYVNKSWGLIPLNIALWWVCITGLQRWGD